MFGSNGRTRSVTRRVYPRECERRDARARELARSLARAPRLLFYVRALSIVVDVMRCARAQAAAADDRCGRCCRWTLPCVVGGGAVPLPYPSAVWPQLRRRRRRRPRRSLLASDPSRDGLGDEQARAEKRQQQQAQRRWYRQRHPMRSHRIVVAHAERWLTLPRPPPAAAYPTPTHQTYVLVTRDRVPTTARWPGLVIHSDALLLEIR